jgi:hypothetical protein
MRSLARPIVVGVFGVAVVGIAACGRRSAPSPTSSASSSSSNSSSAPANAEPADPPPALVDALDAALTALANGDLATTDTKLAKADAIAGDDAHLAYFVARVRATRFVQVADFDRAATTLLAIIPALAKHPELHDEFSAHNTMMMIREAQGDPAAALAEDDRATQCAARGTWDPDTRATLAFQKDRWHRAYLSRMLAESRTGAAKESSLKDARAALDDYRPVGFPDSIAVLEAYFAALDGRSKDALAAARRVDLVNDDDVEDLYLVVVGLEAGGDHAGADAVRAIMRRPSEPRISRTIMLRWLDIDAKWPEGGGFTPWHAAPH